MCTIPFVATNTPQSLWALWLCSFHHPSLSAWASSARLSIPVSLPQCCYLTPGSTCFLPPLQNLLTWLKCWLWKCNVVYYTHSVSNSVSSLELSDINIYSNRVICLAASLLIATTKQTRKRKQFVKVWHSHLGKYINKYKNVSNIDIINSHVIYYLPTKLSRFTFM